MSVNKFRIKLLEFSGGQSIPLPPGTVLLLVGPNNSGKSAALREMSSWLTAPASPNYLVLKSIEFEDAPESDLIEHAKSVFQTRPVQGGIGFSLPNSQGLVWRPNSHSPTDLQRFFSSVLIQTLDTQTRLSYCNPTGWFDVLGDLPPQAAIQWLQKDPAILERVNVVMREAFSSDLVPNYGRGNSVQLHLGEPPKVTVEHDRISREYLKQLGELPRLEQLGDGVRSFAATTVAVHAGAHPVLLVDEPEAFLHPPQAMRLGRVIGRVVGQQNRQAIAATHSADFIRGVLAATDRVVICRIERSGSVNNASLLSMSDVKELWSSPLLRSSHAIDGLLREGVVVCEADADARLYEAVLENIAHTFSRPIDLYFVHGGGKGALATFAKAYRRLKVPTAVIADIDLLKNCTEFSTVYTALGGDLGSIQARLSSAVTQLADQGAVLPFSELAKGLREVIATVESQKHLATESRRKATQLLENAADWSEAKKYGIDKLKGGARENLKALLDECATVGLFLVPVGELEGWWRDGPATKREWIVAALDTLSSSSSAFAETQKFVTRICSYFGYQPDA